MEVLKSLMLISSSVCIVVLALPASHPHLHRQAKHVIKNKFLYNERSETVDSYKDHENGTRNSELNHIVFLYQIEDSQTKYLKGVFFERINASRVHA